MKQIKFSYIVLYYRFFSLPGQVLNASKLLSMNGDWTSKVVLEYSMHLIFKEKILNMNFLTCVGNVINVPCCLSKLKTFLVWLCWLSFGVTKFYFLLLPLPLCFLTKPTCCKNLSKMTSYMLHITHHGTKSVTLKKSLCLWIWK